MWQMRLFGKTDYENIDVDDSRNQWTPLFEVSGNEVYDNVDVFTVKCKTKFRVNDNVLIAYADNVMIFGYITRARTLVADAQYEFEVSEYLNMLTKYPVPRFGTTTYKQIASKDTSMRSRIDNFSYPGGKKTLKEIMDIAMSGAGDKWSHMVDDFYFNGNDNKDILGPYYRWNGITNPSSGYDYDRWYNIPEFTQAPGSYGQLPTPPNYDMVVDGRNIVQVLNTADSEFWDQVYSIPWMADEDDVTPDASLAEFKKKIVRYFPTVELCASTVFSTIKRMLVDLCKMNVWCEVTYDGGDFLLDATETESISKVRFIVKYGYVRDHKVQNPMQYIQYRSDDKAEDTDVECVLVFGYDHTTDVGMAVRNGASIPYKTLMWEYKDGRNEGELDALAYQILNDYKNSKLMVELDLKPGPAMYDDEIVHVGDMIRVQNNDIIDYHLVNGWYDESDARYARRMEALVAWEYLSEERNDAIFTVKAIRYSISKTTLELSEARTDIFEIMGDKLSRIEGTTQGYNIDEVIWKKADLSLCGRPAGEVPYTNTDVTSFDYGNIKLISSLPSVAPGTPTNFLTWDGLKWIDAIEYIGDNYPAWTQLLIMCKDENHMPEIPDSRGMVPLNYIGPWFNIEVKIIGGAPSMSHSSNGGLNYNNPSAGNAWVIPYVYGSTPATSVWSTPNDIAKLVIDGKYELPDVKCRLPEAWRTGIYFEGETDCLLAPELLAVKTTGAAGVGCLNYVKIGPIPKGFDNVTVSASMSFFDQVFGELAGDSASTLNSTITSRNRTGLSCFVFNFQWCIGRDTRPRSTSYNEITKQNRQGYWDANGTLIPEYWDDEPTSAYDGKWTNIQLSPVWSSGYAVQNAALHSNFNITDKRMDIPVEDASLYLRYLVFFDSFRSNTSFMYNFVALAGWSVSVVCTPGYELLAEWYKVRTHTIQMMVDGKGSWDRGNGNMVVNPISVLINWPDPDHTNEDGYFCFDIKKFLGPNDNYVRFRSVKTLSPGIYVPVEIDIRARFISGWVKGR